MYLVGLEPAMAKIRRVLTTELGPKYRIQIIMKYIYEKNACTAHFLEKKNAKIQNDLFHLTFDCSPYVHLTGDPNEAFYKVWH